MTSFATQSKQSTDTLFWGGMAGLTLAAILLAIYITPYGMGLVNDSVGYIGGARNILVGNGFSRLTGDGRAIAVSNYPPLFSIGLAGIGLFGPDAVDASWLLNVTLFGVNVFLMGLAVRRITGSVFCAWLGALFFGFSAPILQTHSFAMSEPLYLCLSFLSLLTLGRYLEDFKWHWLAAAGLSAGLAFLTRYVGLSLFGTGLLAIIVLLPSWRKRLVAGWIFLAASMPLPLAWLIRNLIVSENAANRQFIYHPLPDDKVREGLLNFWGWLLPEHSGLIERLLPILGLVLAALLVVILLGTLMALVLVRSGKISYRAEPHSFILGWLFALQVLVYPAVLWLSLTFVDASPILENRILSPLYVSLIVLGMIFLGWLWSKKKWAGKAAVIILVAGLFLSLAEDTLDVVRDLHKEGQGFASSEWRESETIAAVRILPPEKVLVSNKSTAIYILTGRPAFIAPSPINPATGRAREGYQEDISSIKQSVLDGKSVMVIFGYNNLLAEDESKQWMADLSEGLPVLQEYRDGIQFGVLP
jgi:hypothetical protein